MIANAKNLRISPKKINLVAELVRRKNLQEALDILKFTPKKGASLLAKILASAAANAKNNFSFEGGSLKIDEIIVNKGMTLKRSVSVSRGRMHPILKVCAHVTVKLTPETQIIDTPETEEAKTTKAKTSKKSTTKKPAKKKADQ
jgi:large subunit ribosomal protein L22